MYTARLLPMQHFIAFSASYLRHNRLAEVARLWAVDLHVGNFEKIITGTVSQFLPTTAIKVFLVFTFVFV